MIRRESVDISTFVNIGTDALVILAVLMALYNAFTRSLQSKINSYRLQTFALALLAFLKAFNNQPLFLLVALILFVQFLTIARVLAYITNIEQREPGQSRWAVFRKRLDITKARSVWLHNNPPQHPTLNIVRTNSLASLTIGSALVIFAYVVADQVPSQHNAPSIVIGLGASLALLFVGLLIMIVAYDTLAQTTGLLVMENGLFLAAVIVITNNTGLVLAFLFGMFAWYTLTLVILILFLPRLRQSSGSINLENQNVLKE
jgi:hydrogenase-4 membrane subunit HyfE